MQVCAGLGGGGGGGVFFFFSTPHPQPSYQPNKQLKQNQQHLAYERIKLGANLVQIYSAMIFEGPALVSEINKGILARLEEDGFKNINEAVGKSLH